MYNFRFFDMDNGYLRWEIFENHTEIGYADGKLEEGGFTIDYILIYKDYQDKGAGRALLEEIERFLILNNIQFITGEFIPQEGTTSEKLRAFYVEKGYKIENRYVYKTLCK